MKSLRRLPIVAVVFAVSLFVAACSSSPDGTNTVRARARAAGDPKLAAKLDEVLRRGDTGPAKYTARIVDLQNGDEMYAVDIDTPFMPASNGKIAVVAAAIDFFGS